MNYMAHFAPAEWLRKLVRLIAAVENWPRALLDHLRVRKGTYVVRLRSGATVEVRGGTDDRHVVFEVFAQRVYPVPAGRPAGIVLDVGAHIGCFTIMAARLGYRVISVEPCPENFALLQRNVRRNRLDEIQLVNAAVGSRNEPRELVSPDNPSHTGRFSLFPGRGSGRRTVSVVTLAQMIQGSGSIALLKLDCQGSEYEILYSATSELLQRIDAIMVECELFEEPREWSRSALSHFLRAQGFQVRSRGNLLYADRPTAQAFGVDELGAAA